MARCLAVGSAKVAFFSYIPCSTGRVLRLEDSCWGPACRSLVWSAHSAALRSFFVPPVDARVRARFPPGRAAGAARGSGSPAAPARAPGGSGGTRPSKTASPRSWASGLQIFKRTQQPTHGIGAIVQQQTQPRHNTLSRPPYFGPGGHTHSRTIEQLLCNIRARARAPRGEAGGVRCAAGGGAAGRGAAEPPPRARGARGR